MLRKLIKAAAISLAAVFVLVLAVIGFFVGPPVFDAWQIVKEARSDGTLRGQSWKESLPPNFGKAFYAAAYAPRPRPANRPKPYASRAAYDLARKLVFAKRPGDRTIRYTLTRAVVAVNLDQTFSEDALIGDCARFAYFGRDAFGLDDGAKAWFGKPPSALSVSEAAFLAALPSGPANFDPATHYDRAKARRDLILGRMRDLAFIDEATYQTARAEPLSVIPAGAKP